MCKIIEKNKDAIDLLYKINAEDFVISIPIFSDKYMHSLNRNNELSLLFFKFKDNSSYILPFNHSECSNLDSSILLEFNNIKSNVYTLNKKNFISVLNLENVLDVDLMNYYLYNTVIDVESIRVSTIDILHSRYYNMKNVNRLVPIYKHFEWCNEVSNKIIDVIKKFNDFNENTINSYEKYNLEVVNSLYSIEKSGLKVDNEICRIFDNRVKKHIIDDIVYSNYNIYTSTGRPSNSFGNINFAALNKDTGERKSFISRFNKGVLVEYDYDAYHLRLIGSLIGYNFGKEHVHEHFSKIYDVSYEESKQITFKILYGGIDKDISDNIEFFGKTSQFIDKLWGEFISKKEIKTYIYNRPICNKNFDNIDKNKLFNYFIQSLETEYNIKKIVKIQKLLKDYNSKLVLYGYDSFLFDIDVIDGKFLLQEIRKELESDGFLTRVKSGLNYNDIVDVSNKI